MTYIPSVWKEMGLNSRTATSGLSKKKRVTTELPTEKEIKSMKLKSCNKYSQSFAGSFSKKIKTFKHKKSRRAK